MEKIVSVSQMKRYLKMLYDLTNLLELKSESFLLYHENLFDFARNVWSRNVCWPCWLVWRSRKWICRWDQISFGEKCKLAFLFSTINAWFSDHWQHLKNILQCFLFLVIFDSQNSSDLLHGASWVFWWM